MVWNKKLTVLLIGIVSVCSVHAQVKILKGIILDKQSDEPIPYASAVFKKSGAGALSDSLGRFILELKSWPAGDTLVVNNVGYKPTLIPFNNIKDSVSITIYIEVLPPQHQATVKAKYNRALWFWRRIIAHKPKNDKHHWDNYAYEVYNKLELDLNNVNKEKLEKNLVLKPFNFILDYTDTTSEKKPFLPVYLTETISDYYYQKQPYRTREVIKARNAWGFTNESLAKQLGATYQNVDVYNNTIPVFDKTFISPLADNADNFYNFHLLDTQYMNKRRLVHLSFTPKRIGENTFDGDCWVNDTTYAIQKITMRPSLDVNVNFVKGLTLIQEFKLISDTTWFLYKDKFVVDLVIAQKKLEFKARKTTTYRNILVNSDSVITEISKSKSSEDIVLVPNTENLPDSFWVRNRFEPLNKNEQNIYKMLDTLQRNKTFLRYKNTIDFLTTGTKYVGNFVIGPWYYWISGNSWEGTRVRFDLATNQHFSEHWYLHGYLAYGFKDQKYKGQGEIRYQFSRKPWSYVNVSYKKDIDNGQVLYDQLGSDNIFVLFFRKPNITHKYQEITKKEVDFFSETNKNFSVGLTLSSRQYNPLENLPGKEYFPPPPDGDALNTFDATIRLRYAYQERFVESNFDRYSWGSDYPILQLTYTHGFPGVLNSSYTYNKLTFSISDYLKIPPYGTLRYNLFAGKVFGTLPYQLLVHQPGNDWYYYSNYSFNLMTRFEYLTDRYAGFSIEHNIGSGLFRYIPLTRKLKLRQFWEAKGVVGNLSDANKQLNFVGDYPFKSLDGKLYTEVGIGIDNIFKFFRIDFMWRVLPRPLPEAKEERFGVFFGFRVSL